MPKNIDSQPPILETRTPIVAADETGMRLDRWFKRHYSRLTHGQLQKWLRTGQIRIDGKRAEASDHLVEGQRLRLPPQLIHGGFDAHQGDGKGARPIRDTARLRDWVLYEDDDIIALNKPAGLAVQGGTGLKENLDDSLMEFSRDGTTKPKLVHRLDRDTGGVLLVARNDYAARKLTEAFRDRETEKIYWAITVGVPKPREGKIDLPLTKRGEIMIPVADVMEGEAKTAVTLYRVVESVLHRAAFVALWPITGRTHQLRAHLAHLGTPILGDRLYGGDVNENLPMAKLGKGLHLHARRLIMPHPRQGTIDVTAPLGQSMRKTWRWFGFESEDRDQASGIRDQVSGIRKR